MLPRNISNHFPRPVGAARSSEIQQLQASEGPSDQISAISLDGAFSFSFRAAVPNVFQNEKEISIFSALDVLMARDKGPHSLSLPIFVQSDLLLLLLVLFLLGKKRQNGRRRDGAWSSDRSRMERKGEMQCPIKRLPGRNKNGSGHRVKRNLRRQSFKLDKMNYLGYITPLTLLC